MISSYRIILQLSFILTLSLTAQAETKIRIGLPLSLTGAGSYHADAILKGARLAQKDFAAKGIEVELLVEDDQTIPAKSVSAVRSILARDVRFFLGPQWSFLAKAAEPVLKNAKALALIPAGSSLINGGPSESFLNLCPRRDKQIEPLTAWLKTIAPKNVFILTANADWGDVHKSIFEKAAIAAGVPTIIKESFDYGQDINFFRSVLLKKKRIAPDLILMTSSAADFGNIIRARSQLKLTSQILGTTDLLDAFHSGLFTEKEAGEAGLFTLGLVAPSSEFSEKFKAEYQETAKLYSDRSYAAITLLHRAISNTDGSVKEVKEYLKSKEVESTALGRAIRFDENGDLDSSEYLVEEVKP